MPNPTVSFVVPCYRLAQFLSECIESILEQTYGDFEVLIMDDCSPDNTKEVSMSFRDSRIRYIRNDPNLGALRNYNKGISQSRGKYVWLISADDYLRKPYVLKRYVELLENNPKIGYAFCPGVGVRNGKETELLGYSFYGGCDAIVNGHVFLKRLLNYNFILAASAMARRECYEKAGLFPLDGVWAGVPVNLIWGGDWYLWSVFALFFDVAYFAEPMVCYREHELSMTNTVTQENNIDKCSATELSVLWLIRQKAIDSGLRAVSKNCLRAIANEYARQRLSKRYRWLDRSAVSRMTAEQFEESLCRSTQNENERNWVRARLFEGMGDIYRSLGDAASAKKSYMAGLHQDPLMIKAYAKLILLLMGRPGHSMHTILSAIYNHSPFVRSDKL